MPLIHHHVKNQTLSTSLRLSEAYVSLCNLKIKTLHIIQAIAALGLAFLLGGILALSVGQCFAFSSPLLALGAVFLILSGLILIMVRKRLLSISIPTFLDLTLSGVAKRLKNTYALGLVLPYSNKINKNTEYIFVSNPKTGMQLSFYKGHPINDPLLKNKSSAIVLCTNSERDSTYVINRTLALIGRIEKECWNDITKPNSTKFPPGSIAYGPWINKSQERAPASHLIFINPPTIEILLHTKRLQKAITFQDFNHKEAFKNLVDAYLKCFRICRENKITSLQLELLGLNDISSHQEEYEMWYSQCALALLEAIRIEEKCKERTVKQITVNHQKELPLLSILQKAYNN
ncbi:hypothetical protein SBV42_03745 [Chlamydia crocodili]|uniref:Macro domain-containing protein n=1 Tax=Chlamydia crocodili TaxID=2766982 RepID=A0ABX8CD07_9CHLA|nr:hypothetical protein [Chlamydia crocodili]QVE48876.1 hypothetical protein H9Q19_04115 [Chlamydia crocodili]